MASETNDWQGRLLPNHLTLIQQACINCGQPENNFRGSELSLQRCSGCRRVSYCSTPCQRKNWREHKSFCRAFSAIESDPSCRSMLHLSLPDPDTPNENLVALNSHANIHGNHRVRMCELFLDRPLTLVETNLLAWDPRCMVCARTDQDLRMDAAQTGLATAHLIRPCPSCTLTFFCSTEHQKFAQHMHYEEQLEDGISHCEMCKRIVEDIGLGMLMRDAPSWVPDRVKGSWVSLKDQTWEGEYARELADMLDVPYPGAGATGPLLRFTSDKMTLALTILWALENLNRDDAWSRQPTLTVHILGASSQEELVKSSVFEEIMHRLPEVDTLILVMVGPDLAKLDSSALGIDIEMDNCPKCRQRGRKRIHHFCADMYDTYVREQGTKFIAPDLAIAFNSGVGSGEHRAAWRPTIELLVQNKIPSLFTSYNSDEAQADSQALKNGGAQLLPVIGPRRNPWGSQFAQIEPHIVRGFYSGNRFIAGGFRAVP